MLKFAPRSIVFAGLATLCAGAALAQVDPAELAEFEALMPEVGEYRTTARVTNLDAPGLPGNMQGMVQGMMSQQMAKGHTYCVTEADRGKDWLENLANSDCTVNSFDVSGNSFTTQMSCQTEDGADAQISMRGTANGNDTEMVMTMDMTVPEMGAMSITTEMQSTRIGDC